MLRSLPSRALAALGLTVALFATTGQTPARAWSTSPISDRWAALGETGGPLGAPLAAEHCGLPQGGCVRDFAGGSIYWTEATGAHDVRGAIRDKYQATGGPAYMGYPTSDDSWDPNARGVAYTNFQHGDIVWSAGTGAQVVRGEILRHWLQTGASLGPLGVPVSSDTQFADGGFVVDFERGSILWSEATGAHDVRGAILRAYESHGGPQYMGYPTSDDSWDPNARWVAYTNFQRGDIVWSAGSGAQVVRGAILEHWLETGASAGGLGVPVTSDTQLPDGGFRVDFQRGSIYWSAGTLAHDVRGAIRDRFNALGGVAYLGYPTTDDRSDPRVPGAWSTSFTKGEIVWSAGTGAQAVRGPILDRWRLEGGSGGPLGLPVTSDAVAPGGQGWVVDFQRGSVYWKNGSGSQDARGVPDPVNAAYRSIGGPASWLGYPKSSIAYDRTGSTFEGGRIAVDSSGRVRFVRG